MSNALTGDYDVVLEVAARTVDDVLASLHRQGASDTASPKLLHSFSAAIGQAPTLKGLDLAQLLLDDYFGSGKANLGTIPQHLLAAMQDDMTALQAAAAKLANHLGDIAQAPAASSLTGEVLGIVAALSVVRGGAYIQMGAPGLIVAPSTSEVSISAPIRAAYTPYPGTEPLPEPIHGDVLATFLPKYNPSGANAKPALEIKLANHGISFTPAKGTLLKPAQVKKITHEVERFVRDNFGTQSVQLPANFPFRDFKIMVGAESAIALPLRLSYKIFPAFSDSVTKIFLDPGDNFAIAISKDYVWERLQQSGIVDQIKQYSPTYELKDAVFGITWSSFHAWVTNVALDWSKPGTVTVVVTGSAHLWVAVGSDQDYNFTITQALKLSLDVKTQAFSLAADGPPAIAGLPPDFAGPAQTQIQNQITPWIDQAQGVVQQAFSQINVNDAFSAFDPGTSAKYTAVDTTPDGVILRGSARVLGAAVDPVVDFTETPDGAALTAFKSWIPGGTIDDFVWSWTVGDSILPWRRDVYEVHTPHSFIFRWSPKPGQGRASPPPWQNYNVCLELDGTQAGKGSVSAQWPSLDSSICGSGWPQWLATMPSWWQNLLLGPVWGPDPGPDGILEDAIIAHMNVRPAAAPAPDARSSVLVHFAGGEQPPLPPIGEALRRSKHRNAQIPVIVVLPRGALRRKRSSVEESLGLMGPELALPLIVTEDYESAWTQAFSVSGGAATYLLSPEGEISWNQPGRLDAKRLTAALDEHASPATRRRSRRLRIALRVGEPAPDLLYEFAEGHQLRGRRALLAFCKSWSTPCIKELARLQQVHQRAGAEGPVVLAVADGEDADCADEIVRQHHLQFPVVADPRRQLGRPCAINCWPTLVAIRPDGLINAIRYGAAHDRRRRAAT
jgi:hypothetical protein